MLLGAQLVLVPVHAVEAWIYCQWPASGRRRAADAAVLALAGSGWLVAALLSSGASASDSRIWPVILGSTAGYLAFTTILLAAWLLLYGRRASA